MDDRTGSAGAAPRIPLRRWQAYALAIVVPPLAMAPRLATEPRGGDRPVLIMFIIPMIFSAYIGGLGPGLASTAVAALGCSYYLMPPLHALRIAGPLDGAQWAMLVIAGILVSVLTEALHRSRRRDA